MTRKSSVTTGMLQPIPAAFMPAHVHFMPVPAELSTWLHSIWMTHRPAPDGTDNQRCYPDGGVSLTFSIVNAHWQATVLFNTLTTFFIPASDSPHISFRFRPGAFSACFGIQAEALPRNITTPLSDLCNAFTLPSVGLDDDSLLASLRYILNGLITRRYKVDDNDNERALLTHLLKNTLKSELNNLSQQWGCTMRTLQRQSKQWLGLSPKELILFSRIYSARQQLVYTRDALSDIALNTGYFDQAHFTNHFHEFVGETPATYRQRKLSRFSNIS